MGLWGGRPQGREDEVASAALPADRLSQLMAFVERATVPAPEPLVQGLPPRIVPSPRYTESLRVAAEAMPVEPAEPAPATPVPAPLSVQFPEPILVHAAPVAGKRRRLLPQSA